MIKEQNVALTENVTVEAADKSEKIGRLIWVLTDTFTELHATTWLEPARELQNLGWDITLTGDGEPARRRVSEVDIAFFPMRDVYFVRQLLFHLDAAKLILAEWDRVDVVYFQQMSALWLLPLKLLRWVRRGKRPIFVMDTRDLNSADGGFKTQLRVKYYEWMQRLANWFADGQTTITTRMAELVNIPPARLLSIWPSGVDLAKFAISRERRVWPKAGEPIKLGYVGRLHPERCLLPLVEAVKQANQEGMLFEAYLVGNGPDEAALKASAAASNGRVHILDPIPHEEVPRFLGDCHIGVTSLPPVDNVKFQASSPIKIFEYMAAGMPILATRNVCHTQVIDGKPYAFWAENPTVDDLVGALRAAWAKHEQLQAISTIAEEDAVQWSWHEAARKITRGLLAELDKRT